MANLEDQEVFTGYFAPTPGKPIFGSKLPFGKHIEEIAAGQRFSRDKDHERAQRDDDFSQMLGLVAQEFRSLKGILLREGMIDDDGKPTGDTGSGKEDPGQSFTIPDCDWPPSWWDDFMKQIQTMMDLIIWLEQMVILLLENKEFSNPFSMNGESGGELWQMMFGFNKGKWYGDLTLDSTSEAKLCLPGTVIPGDLPLASKMFQNRIYADLKNNRKIHVATSPGDLANFFIPNPMDWFFSQSLETILLLDPSSLAKKIGFGRYSGPSTWPNILVDVVNSKFQVNGRSWFGMPIPSPDKDKNTVYILAGADAASFNLMLKGSAGCIPTLALEGATPGTGQRWYVQFDPSAGVMGEFQITQGGHAKLRIESEAAGLGDAYFGNPADHTDFHIYGNLYLEGTGSTITSAAPELVLDNDVRITGTLEVEDGGPPGSPYVTMGASGFVVDGTLVDMEGATSVTIPVKGSLLKSNASTGAIEGVSAAFPAGTEKWLMLIAGSGFSWQDPWFKDADIRVTDNSDATKKLRWEVSGVSTGTTRTHTVPDRNVAPAEYPCIGTTPPAAAAGQQFYDSDLGEWFFYDSTRAKWLSMAKDGCFFGTATQNTTDQYLPIGPEIPVTGVGNELGEWAMYDGTIVGAWIAIEGS